MIGATPPVRSVLVFGRGGQLGRELASADWGAGTKVVLLGRAEADLAEPATLPAVVERRRPGLVVIAAAYTAVDRAEAEPDLAGIVNAEAPGVIAAAAAELEIPIIHVSTDYVFDGRSPGWYRETDPVAPLGVYGATKEDGERRVRAANPRHVILRTAWLYSPFGSNFVKTMLRLAEQRDEVAIVDDQIGCPTAAGDLAQAIAAVAQAIFAGGQACGTFHAAGSEQASWYEFADGVFGELSRRGIRRPVNTPIPSSGYPTQAPRPANSRLCSDKLAEAFGLRLPSWRQSVPAVMDALLGPDAAILAGERRPGLAAR